MLFFAFGALLYMNTASHQFVRDDFPVIVKNRYVSQGLGGVVDILRTPRLYGYHKQNDGTYRPLPLVMHAVEYQLSNQGPRLGHIMNIVIYALTGVLLFLTLNSLLGKSSQIVALLATGLFIAHPIHTEVVANIKSRDELLSFLLSIAAFYFALRFVHLRQNRYLLWIGGAFFFALASKESAAVFLVLIPFSLWYFQQDSLRNILKVGLSLSVTAVAFLAVRFIVFSSYPAVIVSGDFVQNILTDTTFIERLPTAAYVFGQNVLQLIRPYEFLNDYSYASITAKSYTESSVLLSFLLCIILLAGALYGFRTRSLISFGILLLFLTLIPFSNVFFTIGTIRAERLLYSPSLGIAIAMSAVLIETARRSSLGRITAAALSILILVIFSFITVVRSLDWQNAFLLNLRDLDKSPENSSMNRVVGDFYRVKGKCDTAQNYFQRALSIYPDNQRALGSLANCAYTLGDFDTAVSSLRRIIEIAPGNHSAHENLGKAYEALGEKDRAEQFYKQAAQLKKETSSENPSPGAP